MKKVPTERPKKTSKQVLITVSGILIALLAVVLIVCFAVKAFLFPASRLEEKGQSMSNDPAAAVAGNELIERSSISEEVAQMFADRDVINILLTGQERNNEGEEPQQTDAIILCTINAKSGTVTLTSLLGNLWVYIPELYNQRLNTPYMLGGFPLLNDTLDYNFGVRADYSIEMDFSGFMKAIDILGGIEVHLTDAESKYLNQHGSFGIEENCNWNLSEGVNNLSGAQALAYTRICQLGTDFARVERQHAVLKALVKKAEQVGSAELFDCVREILPLLSTNMTDNQILGLLLHFLPVISDLEIKTQHIPLSGEYSFEKKGKADVLIMDKEQLELSKKLLRETISG